MNARVRITTFATLALFFLALVLGARFAVRQIAAPFDGIEHFVRMPRAPAPMAESDYGETIRKIDWDAPVAAAPAAKVKGSTRTAPQVSPARLERIAAGEYLIRAAAVELKEGTHELVFTDVSFTLLSLGHEPDLEALTSALKLTEAQKACVAALIDWRKGAIDALTDLKAKDESKERINESFREAVKSLLDAAQAKKYEEMKSGGAWQLVQSRGAATVALTQVGTATQPEFVRTLLKDFVEKRKTE
ncbi:MAG TPA: hypothetical protein VFS19_02020 [Planctomycetota bacterium]|nr:hypothetical protein [Planctomycetota bacterium]